MASEPPDSAQLDALPILPLRNSVLFPASVVPINVGRPRSVRLVQELLGRERAYVGVVSQHKPETNEPTFDDLHRVGTIARVVKVIRLGPSNYSVVLNGLGRMQILSGVALEPHMRARVARVPERREADVEIEALGATLRESTREVLRLMPNLPRETAGILDKVRDPAGLADLIAANFPPSQASVADKQQVLEAFAPKERVKLVLGMVAPQLEVLRVKKEISGMVEEEITRSQREEMLRQQMSSIREALGEADDEDELEQLRTKVRRRRPPREVMDVARKQLARLNAMAPQSAEYNVTRNYVEWLGDLPWSDRTADDFDVQNVRRCLDEDHHGLAKVKKRIVEFAAIRQLRTDMRGPILLFVGPPGVGKTSLGRSIARATGRHYERVALGGVRDEAEIRGHRRTYVGALPGRIIQALKRAGSNNPVLVLDEVEKMGADVRGDPTAALLEVLDPEQNNTFRDHYLEVAFDLSNVMFLATANTLRGCSPALLDRMEIIEVPGYTRTEKMDIARDFLIPKQLSSHGMTLEHLDFTDEGIAAVVDHYTREAGVRNLERQLGAVCRATAVRMAEANPERPLTFPVAVDRDHVERVLGAPKHRPERAELDLKPGVSTGLSASSDGGRIMFVETSRMPGKGRVHLTGNLRPVMEESATAAVTYVRSKAEALHLDPAWLQEVDLHIHIPNHGIPKDGAAAGLAVFVAVSSLLLGVPVRSEVAVTGELSLRGRVLRVDGIVPKLLAAHRAGLRTVLIPARNRVDLEEVPGALLETLDIKLIDTVDEVLPLVLQPPADAADGRDASPPSAVHASP
ncbi:MAG: endopeptidase La [Myxococcota bacterium]